MIFSVRMLEEYERPILPLDGREGLVLFFTVGDQLLWGAAEPLRRMLGILLESERA